MNGTRTLIVLTVPGVGKTWYKNNYDFSISKDSIVKSPIVFDMGNYNDKSIKEREAIFLNLIYITRKLNLDSVIMDNYSEDLVRLSAKNHFPCYVLIPPDKTYITHSTDGDKIIRRMNMYPYKTRLLPGQYLSDKISLMWNDEDYNSKWMIYDNIILRRTWVAL